MRVRPCLLQLFKVIFCGRLNNQYVSDPVYLPYLLDEKISCGKNRGIRKGVKGLCSLKPALLRILLQSRGEFAVIQL